jgi:LPS-assembly lipoprotein
MALRLASLMLCMMVSACGFQLRGNSPGPAIDLAVHLQAGAVTAATRTAVIEALTTAGLELVAPSEARLALVVNSEQMHKWPIANSLTLNSSDYELVVELHFRLENIDTGKALAVSSVRASAHFESDRSNLLASRREEGVILAETRKEVAQRLAERVRFSASR